MSDDAPAGPDSSAARDARRLKRRRFASYALLAGFVLAFGTFAKEWPRERQIVLRLGDPATVEDVSLAWKHAETTDALDDDLLGTTWHFEPGKAPEALKAAVSLPDGTYSLAITIRRAGGDAHAVQRRVTLDDWDELTLPVQ